MTRTTRPHDLYNDMECANSACKNEATHPGLTKPVELCKECSKFIIFMVETYGSKAAEVSRGLLEYKLKWAKIDEEAEDSDE